MPDQHTWKEVEILGLTYLWLFYDRSAASVPLKEIELFIERHDPQRSTLTENKVRAALEAQDTAAGGHGHYEPSKRCQEIWDALQRFF
ncbi:MAG: hypothetical protein V2A73_16305 [Pseudomonadota bacterium]